MSKKGFLARSAAQAHSSSTSKTSLRIKQIDKETGELSSLSETHGSPTDIHREPPSLPHTAQSFPPTPESPELPSPVAGANRKRDWSNEEADINMVNAFRQNCSQDGNNYQDCDLILGVPAKRASIMDVHAATDPRYLRDVIKTEDVTSRPSPLSSGSEVNTFRQNCSQEGNISIPFDPGEDPYDPTRRESLESAASSHASFSSPTSPISPPAANHSPPKKPKREGKDEKLAREKGLNIFISVYDIINIQMGKIYIFSMMKGHNKTFNT